MYSSRSGQQSVDRTRIVSKPKEIDAWVNFNYAGRNGKYSSQIYHWYHFNGVDYDDKSKKVAIYQMKPWSKYVDKRLGNYDYLMFANVDYTHPEVQADVKDWGVWITNELGLRGFRLDAVKHYSWRFVDDWIKNIRKKCNFNPFIVAEYWESDLSVLRSWLSKVQYPVYLFDTPLVENFSKLSTTRHLDLRDVLKGSLVLNAPQIAVTLVMSHDTQPGQESATEIRGFIQLFAYCVILLREQGYPCVFYGNLYGIAPGGPRREPPSCDGKLADLMLARKLFAYGPQTDYFDNRHSIGWVRRGTWDRPHGLACVMARDHIGVKKMFVGESHVSEEWTDLLDATSRPAKTRIDATGFGVFTCKPNSVGVWVNDRASIRQNFPVHFDSNIYGRNL